MVNNMMRTLLYCNNEVSQVLNMNGTSYTTNNCLFIEDINSDNFNDFLDIVFIWTMGFLIIIVILIFQK
jgi:hypothetical protein